MLQIYIQSIIIWLIILYCTPKILRSNYITNGWVQDKPANKKGKFNLIMLSAVPVFRAFIFIIFIIMAFVKKEDVDKHSH